MSSSIFITNELTDINKYCLVIIVLYPVVSYISVGTIYIVY